MINERQNLLPNEVSQNRENIQLIWLDRNIKKNSFDSNRTMEMLIELNPAAQFYSDSDRCLNLIKSIKNEQIFLIVSGSLVRQILKQVKHHHPLTAIFIFCANCQHHQSLINEYDTIIGIYTDKKTLIKDIGKKMNVVEKQTLVFNLFDQKQKSLKDLSKESAAFLWNQMLIFVLKQIPQDQQSKQQMVDLCQNYYRNNKEQLKKIETFDKTYKSKNAIEWYTDAGFLSNLLNKALRTEDIELLFTFRFFLVDLCAEIENEKMKDKGILTVYRGTKILNEELQKIIENIGKTISTNGFLSTSKNIDVSLLFASSDVVMNGFQSIMFEIEADSSLGKVSFADIESRSRIKDEEEVLFNINTTFQIHSVDFDKKMKIWRIKLITSDQGSDKIQEYISLTQKDLDEYSPIIYFGALLLHQLGQVERAKKYFEMLLKSLPSDHPDIDSVYNYIGNVHRERDEYNLALKNYEKGYAIRRQRLSSDDPRIAVSLNNIGLIHRSKGNYDLALEYYHIVLKIDEINYPGDHLSKAKTIQNIGSVYTEKNAFDTALIYLSRALETFERLLPTQHPQTAWCLGTIGAVHEKKGDYDVGLTYYHRKLNMLEQCLPFDHSTLSLALQSIVNIYQKKNNIKKGLAFCQEKLVEQKNRLGENHLSIARTLMIMSGTVSVNNIDEQLIYAKNALSVLETCIPSDHRTTSNCLTLMAALYRDKEMLKDALQCYFKALDIRRQILSSDHKDIALNLRMIGDCYKYLKDPFKALRYFNESLSILQANYGSDHADVKILEADIARLSIS